MIHTTRQLPMAAITGGIDHPAKLLELIDPEALQAARRVRLGAPVKPGCAQSRRV
ncbi:MAG: hypothetical protein U0Z44_06610 [Kouleothrix sp.]